MAVLAAPAVNSDAPPPNCDNESAQLAAIVTSIIKCLCMGTFRGCAETLSGYIASVLEWRRPVVKVRDGLLFVIADDHQLSDWRVGIKFAFVLTVIFLLIAGLVLAPLQLYRGTQNS